MNERTFAGARGAAVGGQAMTVQGTVNKTALSLLLLVFSASWIWGRMDTGSAMPLMWGGMIGGLILVVVTMFKMTWAPVTTPLYAVLEGLFIGGLSASFEMRYPGLVIQAVTLTFGTLAALLFAYTSRLINVTQKFRLGVCAAMGGIFIVYIASMVLGLFGIGIPLIHDSGPVGIGFSLFVVVIAAMNLVLQFDVIERGATGGAPKFMEWFGALGMMVALAWLYIEILVLLAKLRGGRR